MSKIDGIDIKPGDRFTMWNDLTGWRWLWAKLRGKPIRVLNTYRCTATNQATGGKSDEQ